MAGLAAVEAFRAHRETCSRVKGHAPGSPTKGVTSSFQFNSYRADYCRVIQMLSYDFRVKRDVTLASGCRRSHFARSLEPLWQMPPATGHTWPGKHLILRSAVAVGLWLVPTAGLAESLWLQSTAALAESGRLEVRGCVGR